MQAPLADASTSARRPTFDGLTIGLHWATVLFVLAQFGSAWLHTLAEVRQSDFTPVLLQIHRSIGVTIWGRHGASLGLAADRREPAAFPDAHDEAASRRG
jgi:cytochrome b561